MPQPAVCPHCSEELDIPSEFRGRQVRCAACQQVFVPPADSPAPPPPAPAIPAPGTWDEHRPSRRTPREDDRPSRRAPREDYDDRDRERYRDRDEDDRWADRPRRRRREKRSNAWVWLLVLGVFGLCVLPCGGLMVLGIVTAFPTFEPYDSPDGRFHAEFPGKPAAFTRPGDDNLTRHYTEYRRSFPPEKYAIYYVDLTARAAAQPNSVLKDAADKAVTEVPGSTETSRQNTTHDGHPAVELVLEHPDDTVTVTRFVLVNRRLYAVAVTGPDPLNPEDPRVEHFLNAFKVQSAPVNVK